MPAPQGKLPLLLVAHQRVDHVVQDRFGVFDDHDAVIGVERVIGRKGNPVFAIVPGDFHFVWLGRLRSSAHQIDVAAAKMLACAQLIDGVLNCHAIGECNVDAFHVAAFRRMKFHDDRWSAGLRWGRFLGSGPEHAGHATGIKRRAARQRERDAQQQ